MFKLSLNGSEGKFGFVKIADEYSGTDAGNLANYYAGIAYLNTGKFDEAIKYLGEFKSEDLILSALAKGATGECPSSGFFSATAHVSLQPNAILEAFRGSYQLFELLVLRRTYGVGH